MKNITLFIIVLIFALSGCKTRTILQPVEKIKIEYRDRFKTDSIHNTDSILIYQKNDTVYLNSIKWRERFVKDTVSVLRVDSIPYPVEVIEYTNILNKWQRLRLNALNWILGIIGVFVAFKIGKARFL